jgi:hypothetical protein
MDILCPTHCGRNARAASVKTFDESRKSRQAGAMRLANTFHIAAYALNVAAAMAAA